MSVKSSRPKLTLLSVFSYVVIIFAPVIRNLLSFLAAIFNFELFFTKNATSQLSVNGFKVSIVRLREVSVF